MEYWLNLVTRESENAKFVFIHHSTSSTVQLIMKEGDTKISEFWMDYYELDELCKFIKILTNGNTK